MMEQITLQSVAAEVDKLKSEAHTASSVVAAAANALEAKRMQLQDELKKLEDVVKEKKTAYQTIIDRVHAAYEQLHGLMAQGGFGAASARASVTPSDAALKNLALEGMKVRK